MSGAAVSVAIQTDNRVPMVGDAIGSALRQPHLFGSRRLDPVFGQNSVSVSMSLTAPEEAVA